MATFRLSQILFVIVGFFFAIDQTSGEDIYNIYDRLFESWSTHLTFVDKLWIIMLVV